MSADRPSTEPAIEFEGPYQGQAGPYFGDYGGQWMPESLMAALQELTRTSVSYTHLTLPTKRIV